jgi:CheY-like chemotaxis protein
MTPASQTRILYVEDDPILRRIISRALERAGMEVQTAADGHEGISIAEEWLPDLILLDLMMPVMDGFETAIAFRASANPYMRSMPILAYSACSPESVARALQAGANDFLPKATPHAEIIAAIRRQLSI